MSQGEETSIETGMLPGEWRRGWERKLREGSKVELRPASGQVPAVRRLSTGAER